MKKTMIAMAVAGVVAAPMASAEVSISGKVEQMFTNTDDSHATYSGAWYNSRDAKLVFKASEDLGDGMSAFASIVLDTDEIQADSAEGGSEAGTAGDNSIQDQKVGVSGGFGTVVVGRMEDFTESKVMSMVDVAAGSGVETAGNLDRNEGGIAYVSPSFSGFTVGAAGYVLGAGDKSSFDATDVAVMYANGPLAINVAVEDDARAASGTTGRDTLSIGVKYTAGDLTLAGTQSSHEYDDASVTDADDVAVAAVYNMGNNSIMVGYNDDETAATTGTTSVDNTVVELRHKFSSRTRGYIGLKDSSTAANDITIIGLEHSF